MHFWVILSGLGEDVAYSHTNMHTYVLHLLTQTLTGPQCKYTNWLHCVILLTTANVQWHNDLVCIHC